MPSAERGAPGTVGPAPDVNAELSAVNAVFTLSLILTQASSPGQLIRLVTTAIPSIARCQRVLAWHPAQSGDYYKRAPDDIGGALAGLTEPGPLEAGGSSVCWAFPLTSRRAGEPVFLVVFGSESLTSEEIFLLSVLAQLCGTVIAKLELIAGERVNSTWGRPRRDPTSTSPRNWSKRPAGRTPAASWPPRPRSENTPPC